MLIASYYQGDEDQLLVFGPHLSTHGFGSFTSQKSQATLTLIRILYD